MFRRLSVRPGRGLFTAVLLAACLLPSPPVRAGGAPFDVRHAGTPHDALFAIAADGAQALSVGAFGTILASLDAGATWNRQAVPTNLALLGVAMNGDRAVAVGQAGTILLGRAPGAGPAVAWKPVGSGTSARLLGVALGADGTAVAAGAFGTILRSADGGENWGAVSLDWAALAPNGMEPHLYSVRATADGFIVAGEFGLILRSRDRGATWTATRVGEASLFDVVLAPGGAGVAVGQKGAVLISRDDGATWQELPPLTDNALLGVWLSGQRGRIVGIQCAYRSDDGGRTWTADQPGDTASVWYQAIAGREAPVIVGQGGRIAVLSR